MSTSAPNFWAQMSEGFQQNLSKSWGQAMQNFQTIDLGGLKPSADAGVPQLKFSPEKLQNLQGQYFKDASELWNQGLHNSLPHGFLRIHANCGIISDSNSVRSIIPT